MKIGIDLHGVADKYPAIVKPCLEALHTLGVEIIFLSGPPKEDVGRELHKLGYIPHNHYDGIISVVDFLRESGTHMWKDHKDTWWCSDEDWWSAKAKICRKEGITVVIDDSPQFEPYFDEDVTFILVGSEEITTYKTVRQWAQRKLDAADKLSQIEGGDGVEMRMLVLRELLDFINE